MGSVRNIIERIVDNVSLTPNLEKPENGMILRRVESAHQRVAQELQIPKRYIKDVDATAAFSMPEEARPGGLLYAELENDNDERNVTIPLMTVQEANDIGIMWDTTDSDLSAYKRHAHYGKYLIIYDPVNISAPVYPLGFETGDTLRMLYVLKPTRLTTIDDTEPFDGEMPEYGDDILVQYVTFEILFGAGAEQSQAYYNDYRKLMEEALAYTRPPLWLPRSARKEVML